MEKRIFIAILVSIAVLWIWAAVAPMLFPELVRQPEPPKRPAELTATAPAAAVAPSAVPELGSPATPPVAAVPVTAERVQLTEIDGDRAYTAILSNRGAQLVSFKLNNYDRRDSDRPVDLVKARDPRRVDYPFAIEAVDTALAKRLNSALYAVTEREEGRARVIEYRYSDGSVTATKTFTFGNDPYLFQFAVSIEPPVPYRVAIGPGIRTIGVDEIETQMVAIGNGIVQQQGDLEIISREDTEGIRIFEGVDYAGLEDNYFLTILRPTRGGAAVFHQKAFFDAEKKRRNDLYATINATPDGVVAGDAFFGPKETKLLDRYGMGEALQFGWFGMIARFFLESLVWINQYTNNYGFAIIVLTILIKIVLYPLQHKSIVSMKKMQKVQPKVEAIKAKYKKTKTDAEQRQKMNVEMMQLYKTEGINPMAGCLPLLLQLPILWAFYNLLSRAIELRGAPFILWIQDLSEKDPYYVTPILMTATMFIQTYITPTTADPAQRKIFLMMPLIFGFLFKDFPSGLVLYWLVQNVLTIVQQLIMNKWWKEHPAELQRA